MSASTPVALERHLSVSEIAALWSVSDDTVRRIFRDIPGVIKLSTPRVLTGRKRAPRVQLSIPESIVLRVHEQWSGGAAGGGGRSEVEKRRRSV